MAPGLFVSTAATFALVVSYVLRLNKTDTEAPPKEAIGLMTLLAFFGFSTVLIFLFQQP